MSDERDDVNKLLLFSNRNKKEENSPDYLGRINIQGRWYKLSAWENTSKAGDMYIAGRLGEEWQDRNKKKEDGGDGRTRHTTAETKKSADKDFDDKDIPF
jgi:hypothetical protein